MNKFIFVSGGVCSSLGKGVAASSIGALLEGRGLNVRMVKCDPYINASASMALDVHGEIYVTDDGTQADLDLGNYARFTGGQLNKINSMTTGQIYKSVIEREKEGGYSGQCIQVIPHITDEIKNRIKAAAKDDPDTDVVIVEIGGTVGDIESIPFLEAARQMIHELGRTNALSVHLTLIPKVADDEYKTKPTQHSVKAMQEMGIQPDILICRSPIMLDEPTRKKIALFTNVDLNAVFTSCNIETTIYEVPLMFYGQKLDQVILKKMGVESRHANLKSWHSTMDKVKARKGKVRIGIVGQYMDLHDAYKSVYEALFHSSLECAVETELVKIDSASLEETETPAFTADAGEIDGVMILSGFNKQGINGMLKACTWARINKVPCFSINFGMHIMAVEWARNVMNRNDADSAEFNHKTKYPVVCLLREYEETMRLGTGEIFLKEGTNIFTAYTDAASSGDKHIFERHRHRYALSSQYRKEMTESGLIIAAVTPDTAADETNAGCNNTVECIEWPDHPWGVGVQFNPEFKSKPTAPSPLFRDFINAVKKKKGM